MYKDNNIGKLNIVMLIIIIGTPKYIFKLDTLVLNVKKIKCTYILYDKLHIILAFDWFYCRM